MTVETHLSQETWPALRRVGLISLCTGMTLFFWAFIDFGPVPVWAQNLAVQEPIVRSDLPDRDSPETIKIRRLYVPEDRLVEFMLGRPTYLPLSAMKFREMLSAFRPNQAPVVVADPVRHWIVTLPGGNVQGYSLVRTRSLNMDPTILDNAASAWLSFDEWTLPADYFNLAPVASTSWDSLEVGANLNGGLPWASDYSEVPVGLSVNNQGLFGLPLAEAAPYMVVRYNVTLATPGDPNSHRQLRLPNAPTTTTFVRNRTNNLAPFHINGELLPLSRPPTATESSGQESVVFHQAVSNAPQLIGQFRNLEQTSPSGPVQGRYVEHSTVTVKGSAVHYETLLTLEFREAVRSDLILEVPAELELASCEVNGTTQPMVFTTEVEGNKRLKLAWQPWGLTNQIRLIGTLPPVNSGRLNIPRLTILGHSWMLGNVQVGIESPLELRNYELIDSRIVRCQELGDTQNLSFHWGGPESQVTLLLGKSLATPGTSRTVTPEVILLTADQKSLEADLYLLPDLRSNDSNVKVLEVADSWQVEQVAAFDPRPQPESPADRVADSNVTPLPWLPSVRHGRSVVLVTMPADAKDRQIALRVRAVRPVNQWPIEINCRVVTTVPEDRLAVGLSHSQPCLVSLRGTAGIRAGNTDPLTWMVVTNDEARRHAGELASVVGAGNFRFSQESSILTLQNNAELTGSYDVMAYTQNQLQESRVVQQVHRLLIQPSGPVYEVELESSRPLQMSGRWRVVDEKNQDVSFEVDPATEENRWRIRFSKPLSDSVSILIEQEWLAETAGPLLLYSAPKARSFVGIIDSQGSTSRILRVETPTSPLDESVATTVREFRSDSRRWLKSEDWFSPNENSNSASAEVLATRDRPASSEREAFETSCVYQQANEVHFSLDTSRVVWSSAMVTQATQVDTWRQDGWSTQLSLQVFTETAGTLTVELPRESQLLTVLVNHRVLAPTRDGTTLNIQLNGAGHQVVDCTWQTAHQVGMGFEVGLTSLPARSEQLETTEDSERYLCLPSQCSLMTVPANASWWRYALSRRLISPMIWPEVWPISTDVVAPGPSGWRQTNAPRETSSQHQCWWLQERTGLTTPPTERVAVRVLDQRVFETAHWGILLVGCLVVIGIERVTRGQLGRRFSNPHWWMGGACLALAISLPWPYFFMASTLLLGVLIGCSWSHLWRSLGKSGLAKQDSMNDMDRSHDSRLAIGARNLPSALWFWTLWFGLGTSVANAQITPCFLVPVLAKHLQARESTGPQDPQPAAAASSDAMREEYQAVIIPVDAEQKPNDKVVYLSPELYRDLTDRSTALEWAYDLEIRNSQHTIEYDSQLERFSRLTTQYTCRTQAKKTYLLPSSVTGDNVVRQVRVNGVPVLFQAQNNQIAIPLAAGTNLVSIAYDLQSNQSLLELATLGTSESYVVLNGVPNGWQSVIVDRDFPSTRFRSPIQRRFRIDRIRRLSVEIQRESIDVPTVSLETWLFVQPQQVQCELRLTVGANMKTTNEWLFQVDSRLTLPTGFQPDVATWSLDKLPEELRPRDSKAGAVYRLRLQGNHDPNRTISIPWEFRERSFGNLIPPQIEWLPTVGSPIRKWLVLRIADGLIYRPTDLAQSNYRRANLSELQSTRDKLNPRLSTTEQRAVGSSNDLVGLLSTASTDTFLFEELSVTSNVTPSVVGRLSLQPTQISGSWRQEILLNERSARISIAGEIKVTHGELSQLPIRLPTGAKLQSLAIATAQQNEVAWTIRQDSVPYEEVILLLRTPQQGTLRFELEAESRLGSPSTVKLPWVRTLAPLDISQTLQIRDSTGIWKLRSPETLEPTSLVDPRTFVVSTDSADEIDQMALNRTPVKTEARDNSPISDGSGRGEPQQINEDRPVDLVGDRNSMTNPPRIDVLGSRLVLTRMVPNAHAESPLIKPRPRVEGVQQFLVRNNRQGSVKLQIPAGVIVQRGWVDERPSEAWVAPTAINAAEQPMDQDTQLESESRSLPSIRTVTLPLDPLEEFSILTLQWRWEPDQVSDELGMVEIAGVGQVPVQLTTVAAAAWPQELIAETTAAPNSPVNFLEVVARKIASWSVATEQSSLPMSHPLRTVARIEWQNVGECLPAGQTIRLAPMPDLDLESDRGTALEWDWIMIFGAVAIGWGFGLIWPKLVPTPLLWGDFGWIVLAAGVWLGGGQASLVLLLVCLGCSFLGYRVLSWGFSFRFA